MTLNNLLKQLASEGCCPSLYRRGNQWRAHVNAAGNYWADESTPLKALQVAVKMWKKTKKLMDGMAAEAAEENQ